LAIHQFCRQIALIEAGIEAEPVIKHGNLGTARDMTDARDSAPVIIKLAEMGKSGEAYNIGSGNAMTMQSLLDLAVSLAKVPVKTMVDPSRFRVYDEKVLLSDNSKVKALTSWVPKPDMADTVGSILNYWRKRILQLYEKGEAKDAVVSNTLSKDAVVSNTVSKDAVVSNTVSKEVAVINNDVTNKMAARQCPTENIDIFIAASSRDFPLLVFLMQSIKVFMPCHGIIHFLLDESDMLNIGAWVDVTDPKIRLHNLTIPPVLTHMNGYIAQAWAMMWADLFAQKVGSKADYMMFLDTDSVLGLTVTCKSLFDSEGRIYIAGWGLRAKQNQFVRCVEDMVGDGDTSYMSYFPFTMPMGSFARMRTSITTRLNSNTSNFDEAFAHWTKRPEVNIMAFSQFAVMGAYLEEHEKNLVHPIHCPPYGAHKNSECHNWVSVATHYGWRPCTYVDGCDGSMNMFRSGDDGGFKRFNNKYGSSTITLVEQIVADGTCLKSYIASNSTLLLPGCSEKQVKSIHPELLPYPRDPPPMDFFYDRFYPDNLNRGFCSSAKQ
jgi:hypothetical protein